MLHGQCKKALNRGCARLAVAAADDELAVLPLGSLLPSRAHVLISGTLLLIAPNHPLLPSQPKQPEPVSRGLAGECMTPPLGGRALSAHGVGSKHWRPLQWARRCEVKANSSPRPPPGVPQRSGGQQVGQKGDGNAAAGIAHRADGGRGGGSGVPKTAGEQPPGVAASAVQRGQGSQQGAGASPGVLTSSSTPGGLPKRVPLLPDRQKVRQQQGQKQQQQARLEQGQRQQQQGQPQGQQQQQGQRQPSQQAGRTEAEDEEAGRQKRRRPRLWWIERRRRLKQKAAADAAALEKEGKGGDGREPNAAPAAGRPAQPAVRASQQQQEEGAAAKQQGQGTETGSGRAPGEAASQPVSEQQEKQRQQRVGSVPAPRTAQADRGSGTGTLSSGQEATQASAAAAPTLQRAAGQLAEAEGSARVSDLSNKGPPGEQQGAPLDVQAAAAEAPADRRAAREQERLQVRARLEELHARQRTLGTRRAAKGGGGTAESAPAGVQGQQAAEGETLAQRGSQRSSSQQHHQQQQPSWSLEAAEELCGIGMAPEDAAKSLLAAHSSALRRWQQQQQAREGAEGAGESAEGAGRQGGGSSGPAGAAASEQGEEGALAGKPQQPPAPVTAGDVTAACLFLLDTAGVPVRSLGRILAEAPQLLACTPQELQKQYDLLSPVWRSRRKLALAVRDFPAMLHPSFPTQLGSGLQMLGSLGFTREQVSSAILRCPEVVKLKRHEVVKNLRSAGLDLERSSTEVNQFLASRPHLLTKEGSGSLRDTLFLLHSWRLPLPLCAVALARQPALLETQEEDMQEVVEVLMGYGMSWRQLHAVLLGYPFVLLLEPDLVRLPLKLLADFGISLEEVARYPAVFSRDPVQFLGPRLAYLKAYAPDKLSHRLVSLLSRSDTEFAFKYANALEEYFVFKDAWVRQFEEQVNMPYSMRAGGGQQRGAPASQRWGTVTDELWL